MTRIRKYFVWFFMLSKRLLHQWSFIVLLCMIPIIVPLTNIAMSQESGVVRIALCHEGDDASASKIISSLMDYDGIILFSTTDSEEEAREDVSNHTVDAAWIFPGSFSEKLDAFTAYKSTEPFVEVIEREPSLSVSLAREMLFGAIYKDVSFSIYKNFSYSEIVKEDVVSESVVKQYYDVLHRRGDIISIEKLNSGKTTKKESNYLTAPIRGILALMILLCTLTAAMHFLKEQSEGRFDWLPMKRRLAPALASCLSAACLSAATVLLTIHFSNISTGFINELISILLYVASCTGFCMVLSILFRSPGRFGALIPGLILITLVLSPIFFNMKILRPIQLMLPAHYYLNSVYNVKYYLYTIYYCIVTYALGFLLNAVLANRKYHKSVF